MIVPSLELAQNISVCPSTNCLKEWFSLSALDFEASQAAWIRSMVSMPVPPPSAVEPSSRIMAEARFVTRFLNSNHASKTRSAKVTHDAMAKARKARCTKTTESACLRNVSAPCLAPVAEFAGAHASTNGPEGTKRGDTHDGIFSGPTNSRVSSPARRNSSINSCGVAEGMPRTTVTAAKSA